METPSPCIAASRQPVLRRAVTSRFGSYAAQVLEPRRLLCGIPLSDVIAAPIWSPALERRAQADAHGSGDAASIVWVNRGVTSGSTNDYFADTFGTTGATAARAVVDQVLADWSRAITSWNRSDGTTTLQVNISMLPGGTGFGASASPTANAAPTDGKPRTGAMTISRGNDTNGDGKGDGNGWYLDPTPANSGEYLAGTLINPFAGYSGSAQSDLYTIVNLELTHVLGLITGTGWNGYKLATSGYATVSSSPDLAEAGSGNTSGAKGYYAPFVGPTISHLMTTNNAGAAGSNWGSPIHTAGGAANVTIGGVTYRGSEDSGNAIYDSARYLPSEVVLRILGDAYGYTIADPKTLPNLFAQVDDSGVLNIRGLPGSSGSADVISIDQSGSTITVSIDIGNDIAGSGALPGAGNLVAYVTTFNSTSVNSIVIDGGDGNDSITIKAVKPMTVNAGDGNDSLYVRQTFSGTSLVVNGGNGNDTLNVGDASNTVDPIAQGFTFNGQTGTDTLYYNDQGNSFGDTYIITASDLTRNASQPVGYATLEALVVNAGSGNSSIELRSTVSGTPVTINAGLGNDTITAGQSGDLYAVGAPATLNGEGGTDSIVANDVNNTFADAYTVTSNTFTRTASSPVQFSAESFRLNAGTNNNAITLTRTGSDCTYNLNGGAGNDTLTLGTGDLDPVDGSVTLSGGSGTDLVTFADQNSAFANTVTLASGVFTRTAMPGVAFDGESATYNAGNGADTIDVTPNAATAFAINGNAPTSAATPDTLRINVVGITSPLNTPGTTGAGTWTFGNALGVAYTGIESTLTTGGNAPPTIGTLNASANPVPANTAFALVATGVADSNGTVAGVAFYRESNGTAGLQVGADTLVGNGTDNGSGTWYLNTTSSGLAAGAYTFYARALDNLGAASADVSLNVTISATNFAPVIGSVSSTPNPVTVGTNILLTANGVSDPDGSVSFVEFYRESNGVAGLQVGSDLNVGYDADGSNGWSVSTPTTGLTTAFYTYYAQPTDTLNASGGVASVAVDVRAVAANAPHVNFGTGLFDTAPIKFAYVFSLDVSASLGTSDLLVQNLATGTFWPVAGVTWDAPNKAATFSLNGVPADGSYRATLVASGVTAGGVALDANNVINFKMLSGDANRDGVVGFDDLLILAQHYGAGSGWGYGAGNVNYSADGVVNFDDLLVLAQHYGNTAALVALSGSPLLATKPAAAAPRKPRATIE